jgi:hypothetical protein
MGQKLTKSACVNLRDLPADIYKELTSESYTVTRTSGSQQQGWRIPTGPHEDCPADATDSLYMQSLACNRISGGGYVGPVDGERHPWRLYMVFAGDAIDVGGGMKSERHACGWRRSAPGERTFWPTRLDGDAEAQEAWGLRLDGLLNSLKSEDDLEAGEKAIADAEAAKVEAEAQRLRDMEAKYQADESARYAAAKELRENPVATTGMMIQMRQRETTCDRALRNKVIPVTPSSNFAMKIKELEAISVHDANRLRRLFDNGCPKGIVHWLAGFTNAHADRNQFITEQEAKLYLEPLAQPVTWD